MTLNVQGGHAAPNPSREANAGRLRTKWVSCERVNFFAGGRWPGLISQAVPAFEIV
jgi:hypothetical protein